MQQADKSMMPAYNITAADHSWPLELFICIAGFILALAGKPTCSVVQSASEADRQAPALCVQSRSLPVRSCLQSNASRNMQTPVDLTALS